GRGIPDSEEFPGRRLEPLAVDIALLAEELRVLQGEGRQAGLGRCVHPGLLVARRNFTLSFVGSLSCNSFQPTIRLYAPGLFSLAFRRGEPLPSRPARRLISGDEKSMLWRASSKGFL